MENCCKVKKVLVPKNALVKLNSKHNLIGDNSVACFDESIFPESDSVPISETIDVDSVSNDGGRRELDIKADVVLVEAKEDSWSQNFEIRVNSQDGGTTQVGDDSTLFVYREERKTADQRLRRTKGKSKRKPRNTRSKPKTTKTVITHPVSEDAVYLYNEFAETVLAVLHPLRDDGKWDLFDDKLNEFRSQLGSDVLWDTLLTLEQAQKMCYQTTTSIEQAAQMVCDVLKGIPDCLEGCDSSIKQLIEARGYCYLASIYRHQKDRLLGKATTCVNKALELLETTPFLYDKAIANYEKASIMLDFTDSSSDVKRIRECLDECTNLCHEIHRDKRWDFVKKGRYAILKKVMWLLNSNTNSGRKRTISDDNLQEAKKYLNELQSEGYRVPYDVPVSEQLQCLIASSDGAYRSRLFHESREIVEKAISLANFHGLDDAPALRRLKDIDSMISKTTITYDRDSVSEGDESVSRSSSADASS